jgi:hypothetical protein
LILLVWFQPSRFGTYSRLYMVSLRSRLEW